MTISSLRRIARLVHLAAAALVGVFLYSPLGAVDWYRELVAYGVFPLVGFMGVMLWRPGWFLRRR